MQFLKFFPCPGFKKGVPVLGLEGGLSFRFRFGLGLGLGFGLCFGFGFGFRFGFGFGFRLESWVGLESF